MNVLKILLVIGVCFGQVYLTMAYFNKGGSSSKGRSLHRDINPFFKNSI